MFDTVLVADRGLVACRVVRTCQRLGARAISVHSEADASRLHRTCADESVLIGPADPAASYLDGLKVIEAAGQTGAQAVHPGAGALAGSAAFAAAVVDAGLVWIGPPPAALSALEHASTAAATEPARAGGDVRVMVLAPAEGPVAVLADAGRTAGRWTAPAALADDERDRVRALAASAAVEAGLLGLASVDVHLDGGQAAVGGLRPWLPDCSPVVELVTGLDLVEQQLLVAAGRRAGTGGAAPGGAAVLVTLRARAAGRVDRWELPSGEGLLVESGCAPGEQVGPDDGVLLRLTAWGQEQSQAQQRLAAAGERLVVEGIELEETRA